MTAVGSGQTVRRQQHLPPQEQQQQQQAAPGRAAGVHRLPAAPHPPCKPQRRLLTVRLMMQTRPQLQLTQQREAPAGPAAAVASRLPGWQQLRQAMLLMSLPRVRSTRQQQQRQQAAALGTSRHASQPAAQPQPQLGVQQQLVQTLRIRQQHQQQ